MITRQLSGLTAIAVTLAMSGVALGQGVVWEDWDDGSFGADASTAAGTNGWILGAGSNDVQINDFADGVFDKTVIGTSANSPGRLLKSLGTTVTSGTLVGEFIWRTAANGADRSGWAAVGFNSGADSTRDLIVATAFSGGLRLHGNNQTTGSTYHDEDDSATAGFQPASGGWWQLKIEYDRTNGIVSYFGRDVNDTDGTPIGSYVGHSSNGQANLSNYFVDPGFVRLTPRNGASVDMVHIDVPEPATLGLLTMGGLLLLRRRRRAA